MITFVKEELKKIQKVLNPDYAECSQSQTENNQAFKGEEECHKDSRESLVNIILNFLRRMKQEKLADHLQRSKRISINI